jgi:hypothetical protein
MEGEAMIRGRLAARADCWRKLHQKALGNPGSKIAENCYNYEIAISKEELNLHSWPS